MPSNRKETADAEQKNMVPDVDLAGLWERWCAGDEPTHEMLLARAAELPPEQLVQLLIFDQQRQWLQGHHVRAESFFQQYPRLKSDRNCAVDLVYAEFLLETQMDGPPGAAEYLDRFPEFRTELQRQFDFEGYLGEAEPSSSQATTMLPGSAARMETREQPNKQPVGKHQPRAFGDYVLLDVIATGGMGVVYKARQRRLNRLVALKMIRSGQLAEPQQVERFYTEAQAAANLQHPHIVAIHEVGEHAGQHFYSMDFVEGETLAEMVRQHPLPPQRAAQYVKTIAATMQYAHDHGVLHRDLKPANVLVNEADEPLIADFGLAKQLDDQSHLTIEGLVIGTPCYMPPEQAAGRIQDVGPTSEVYSIGAILYELLTSRPPFRAANRFDTIQQVLTAEPVSPRLLNPSVPRDLETICLKCLQKEMTRRYPSAQELADDLGRFLADEPITARPVGWSERLWRWCHRNPHLATAVGLAAICLLGAIISLSWGYLSTKAALTTAERRLDQTRKAIDELFILVADETLLNKPGFQQLRKDLLLKARDLYRDVLAAEGNDPRIRYDLSVSYFRFGRIMEELGSPEEALDPLHRARGMQQKLLSDRPHDASLQSALSDTWNALGTVLSASRRYQDARPYFQRAHDARRTLVERDPENREYRRKLANISMNSGVACKETGDLPEARAQMETAQQVREELLVNGHDSQMIRRDLAKGYFNLARVAIDLRDRAAENQDIQAFQEHHRRAQEDFTRSTDKFNSLPPDSPWALSDQYLLATCYHLKGRATWEPERTAEAQSLYQEARKRMQSLAEGNPDVHLYQGDLAGIFLDSGILYSGQDEAKSLGMFQAACEILHSLVERYPNITDYRADLATALLEIGQYHLSCDHLDEAARVICQSAEHAKQLQTRLPGRTEYEVTLAQSLELLAQVAQVYLDQGEPKKAIECIQRGLRLNPNDERLQNLRSRLHSCQSIWTIAS